MGTEQVEHKNGGNVRNLMLCLLIGAVAAMAEGKTVYDFTLNSIDDSPRRSRRTRGGRAARQCRQPVRLTPQYTALESIMKSTRTVAS